MADKTKTPRIKKAATDRVPLERQVTAEQLRDKEGHFTDDVSQDADGKTHAITHTVKGSTKVVYLVNPGGAVHDVTEDKARELLRLAGWRMATPGEIAELKKRGGHQVADNPIAKPFEQAVNSQQ